MVQIASTSPTMLWPPSVRMRLAVVAGQVAGQLAKCTHGHSYQQSSWTQTHIRRLAKTTFSSSGRRHLNICPRQSDNCYNLPSSSIHLLGQAVGQVGIKYFTSWDPVFSAKNFARNSGSQTRQKMSKIAVIWVFLPETRNL